MKNVLMVFCLAAGGMMAQDAKVTPLMTKDLAGLAGKEGTMVTVEFQSSPSRAAGPQVPAIEQHDRGRPAGWPGARHRA